MKHIDGQGNTEAQGASSSAQGKEAAKEDASQNATVAATVQAIAEAKAQVGRGWLTDPWIHVIIAVAEPMAEDAIDSHQGYESNAKCQWTYKISGANAAYKYRPKDKTQRETAKEKQAGLPPRSYIVDTIAGDQIITKTGSGIGDKEGPNTGPEEAIISALEDASCYAEFYSCPGGYPNKKVVISIEKPKPYTSTKAAATAPKPYESPWKLSMYCY